MHVDFIVFFSTSQVCILNDRWSFLAVTMAAASPFWRYFVKLILVEVATVKFGIFFDSFMISACYSVFFTLSIFFFGAARLFQHLALIILFVEEASG